MIERIVPAKNAYTVYAGETALHSRYDPVLEAEKYIASLNFEKPYRCFILIEPGLAYLARALHKRFPAGRIITLHCSPFFASAPAGTECAGTGLSWDPSGARGLEDFLEEHLGDTEASAVKIIEWRPSVNAYGRACVELASRAVECVRRSSANALTLKNFGRRWLRNALRNLELLQNPQEPVRGNGPVLVCAAGPSLQDALPGIAAWKQSPGPPFIAALSSAAPALLAAGIAPDMVVSTDGGGWALFHLFESCRAFNSTVIAAGLSAALPSQLASRPMLVLSDGSLWQETLLRSCRIPFLRFPQRGTVSASALDTACYISSGPVYIAGLDLSHRDIITHARPYAFEKLLDASASRLRPFHSQAFERERIIAGGGSHGIYAAWFRTHLTSYPRRLYSLGEDPASGGTADAAPGGIPGIPRKTISAAMAGITGETAQVRFRAAPGNGTDRKGGAGILLNALDNPLLVKQIARELGGLLVPGAETGDAGPIREELERLADRAAYP